MSEPEKSNAPDYVIQVNDSLHNISAAEWNALLALQTVPTPFMRYEYLNAMQQSGCASAQTGWTARYFSIWLNDQLQAASALYIKTNSYGEYVFDHAWANAYHQHGLPYYPKATIAPPFTPVPGTRLLARDATAKSTLLESMISWCEEQNLSSMHLLFGSDGDINACQTAGLMLRHTVQFHWTNNDKPFTHFDEFLMTLAQEKRKKIRQERRKVADAGVTFRSALGTEITDTDWDFFYQCYERTYWEHGNAPYLSRDFFRMMQQTMPENWLLFTAMRGDQAIATSLIAVQAINTKAIAKKDTIKIAYGRYWGALESIDCLHFEACYYQAIEWCIQRGYHRFEGGAQGEHKMARALLPVKATSAHWIAHPEFAKAIQHFLKREESGVEYYLDDLHSRSPVKKAGS